MLAVVTATLVAPAPAAVREATNTKPGTTTAASAAANSTPTLTLDAVPAWAAPGADVHLHVRLTGATGGLLLRVSAHPAITSRTAFSDTLAGSGDTSVVDEVSLPVAFLPHTKTGDTIVPIGLQDPNQSRDPRRLRVEHTGVYPLTISLSPPRADPVATVSTWLVVAEQRLETRLSFAWVWQLVGTPLTSTNRAAVQAAVDPEGRLGRAARAVAAAGSVPISLVLGPETFESWARIAEHDAGAADGLADVRDAVGNETTRQVLATPYVPLDLPSLEAAGLAGNVVRDLQRGADTVQSVLSVLPDPRTVLLDPIDAGALGIARDAFAQRIVVRESAVSAVAHVLTPARPFGLRSGSRVFSATASNDFVDHLLATPGSRAERAQRFLAGLSLIALEAPSLQRGIVVTTPQSWNPDPTLITQVLAGLRSNPFIRPATLAGYFATPPDTNGDGTPIVTTLEPIRPKRPPVTAAQLAAANEALASFRSLVGNHDPRVAQGAHAILIAPSSALDSRTATHELASIDRSATAFLSSISTTRHTITLTSRTALIPLSFTNGTGQTVRVKLHLSSTKLTFPDGSEQILTLPPRHTTLRFRVVARTSGTFTMRVTLTTADDQFTISTTQMTVRSTVFSSIGILLTVGALLFLALWWGNHIWRSHRARRTTSVVEPTA
jgi:hypothetical protein